MTLSIGSGIPKHTAIGIGMWLGLIMAFNVWFVIWPNQKRALGIVDCDPELKAKSARTAMIFFKNKYTFVSSNASNNGSSSKSILIFFLSFTLRL